jgi:photosystem II stability/assembly factor-like uncharacterized protein
MISAFKPHWLAFSLLGWLLFFAQAPSAGAANASLVQRYKYYDITRAGDKDLWIVGYPGVILHSTDQGNHFSRVDAKVSEALLAVTFVSRDEGWIAGRSGLMLHTIDAGKNWRAQTVPVSHPIFDLAFAEPKIGCAVGYFGTLLRTTDSGAHWQKVELPVLQDSELTDPQLNGVTFTDSRHGFIVGEAGTILASADGGQTWARQASGVEHSLFAISFVSPLEGYIVGANGTLLMTSDGGTTWQSVASAVTDHFFAVFAGNSALWMVGLSGLVMQAALPPTSPHKHDLGLFRWLTGVLFCDAKNGFIIGDRGTLLRSHDAGQTWLEVKGGE